MIKMEQNTKSIKTIPINQSDDNWKDLEKPTHSLYNLCSRICSFPPKLPRYFITKYTKKGDTVFDPWAGKSTVPLEALLTGRMGIGNDKSPEAYTLIHAKTRPVNLYSLKMFLSKIEQDMDKMNIEIEQSELNKNAKVFYSKGTFEQIIKLKKVLMDKNSDEAMFTKAVVLGILHGKSKDSLSLRCSHSYSMSPNYVKKYAKEHKLKRPSRNVLECILNKASKVLKDPLPIEKGVALNEDSRKISLVSNSIHMILTSPPYFDVQTYAWCNWLRLWFLGYSYKDIRKTLFQSASEEKYRDFIKSSAEELYRILRPGGKCIIVVGDVKKSTRDGYKIINTAEFISPELETVGFDIEKVFVDEIPATRRVMSYIKESDGIKKERIIFLSK